MTALTCGRLQSKLRWHRALTAVGVILILETLESRADGA